MKPLVALALLSALATAAGCAGNPRFETDQAKTVDFSRFRTFSWQEANLLSGENGDAWLAESMAEIMRDTITRGLERKGFVESGQETPDLLVTYHLVLTDPAAQFDRLPGDDVIVGSPVEYRREPVPVYYEMARVDGMPRPRKATIMLYVLDARTKRLLWQSVASDTVVSPVASLDRSRSVLASMLEQFPEA